MTPEIVKEYYANEYKVLEEIKRINRSADFEPLYNALKTNLGLFLKDCKPIELEKIKELHNFLYHKPVEFFDYNSVLFYDMNRGPYKYSNLLIDELQEELREYIKFYKEKPTKNSIWSQDILASYLMNLNLEIDFDKGLASGLKISNPNINTLLILELLHYYINKKDIGQCADCGKSIVVTQMQKRFYDRGEPIYCIGGYFMCQEIAKDKRGNEKKRLKRLKKKNKSI